MTWLGSVVEGTTLRDDVSAGGLLEEVVESSGNGSICFNCDDNSSKAFLTGSPADREGSVVDGGFVKMVVISVAACFRKSVTVTVGNGTVVGKNPQCHSL